MKRYLLATDRHTLDRKSWQYPVCFERDGTAEFECWREIDANDKRFPRLVIRQITTGETLSSRLEIERLTNRSWRSRLCDFMVMRTPQMDLIFQHEHTERFRLRQRPRFWPDEVVLTKSGEFPLQQSQLNLCWTRVVVRRLFSFHFWGCRPCTLVVRTDDENWTWIAIAVAYLKWTRFRDSD